MYVCVFDLDKNLANRIVWLDKLERTSDGGDLQVDIGDNENHVNNAVWKLGLMQVNKQCSTHGSRLKGFSFNN